MKKIFISIISVYQWLGKVFSKKDSCKFYPDCSHYAQEALQKHGSFKGGYLTFKRLMRCHPWHDHEVDLVP